MPRYSSSELIKSLGCSSSQTGSTDATNAYPSNSQTHVLTDSVAISGTAAAISCPAKTAAINTPYATSDGAKMPMRRRYTNQPSSSATTIWMLIGNIAAG